MIPLGGQLPDARRPLDGERGHRVQLDDRVRHRLVPEDLAHVVPAEAQDLELQQFLIPYPCDRSRAMQGAQTDFDKRT